MEDPCAVDAPPDPPLPHRCPARPTAAPVPGAPAGPAAYPHDLDGTTMTLTSDPTAGPAPAAPRRTSTRRVAVASFVGTTIEWYDFYLYGTAAALVFGTVFFPGADPAIGVLAAFSAYAVGFLARPLGGVVAGHLGDRFGRKRVLVASLLVMGLTTTAIGLLPTYAAVGIAAPVLLVLLRLVQGLSTGAEWGGAVLMSVEHASRGRRGLFGSFTQAGSAAGMLLASGSFAVARGTLTEEQFLTWGWRLPFLASLVLVVVGLVVRLSVEESPLFARARDAGAILRRPVVDVLRNDGRALWLTIGMRLSQIGVYVTYTVFALNYLTNSVRDSSGAGLTGVLVASAIGLASTPLWGLLSDRVGRRPLYRAGAVFGAVFIIPFFLLLDTGNPVLIVLALVLGINIGHDVMYGPQAAYFAELFGTRVRYSGASIGYAVGAVLGGGLTPLISAYLLLRGDGRPWLVCAYLILLSVPTILAAWKAPETFRRDIEDVPAAPAAATGASVASPTRTQVTA